MQVIGNILITRGLIDMPSKTPKQAKLMTISAHTKGGYGGVPQKVGKEFHAADKAKSNIRQSNWKPNGKK